MDEIIEGPLMLLNAAAYLGRALRAGDGEAALKFLEAYRASPTQCPRCKGRRLYRLSDGGYRCPPCLYSFQEHAGRWIGRHRLPPRTWLALLHGIDMGLQVQSLAQLTELSLPTASRVYQTVHLSLAALDPAWAPIVSAISTDGRVPWRFRVRKAGNGVAVEVLPRAQGQAALELPPIAQDDAVMRRVRFSLRGWKRLIPARLALTLKVAEIRTNHQGAFFDLLTDALTRYVPEGITTEYGRLS